jgi:AcrR family transcriptional regulator
VSPTTRDRILWSMVCSLAEGGYEKAGIAAVVERAEVSRGSFDEEFASKEECVLAAYDWVVEAVLERVADAYEVGVATSWPEGVRRGLRAFLEAIAEQPGAARMAAIELPPVGPRAHARYRAAVEGFLPFVRSGRQYLELGDDLPPHVDLMAIGGAEAIIFDELAAGRAEQLPQMLPEILFVVLLPYLGPEDAATEMHAGATPAG